MNARTIALLWLMAGAVVMAQTVPPSQQVAPSSKPVKAGAAAAQKPSPATRVQPQPATAPAKAAAPAANKPAAAPKGASAATKPVAPKGASAAKSAASPMKPKAAPAAKAVAAKQKVGFRPAMAKEKPAAGAVKQAAIKVPASLGPRRDPFTSPIREAGGSGPPCATGKKCLAINAIVLRGIVKSQNGMIAVVESAGGRISYFLRENDPVFNGYVVRISGDTVVFRENVMDRLGQQSTRDVIMKVVAPAV